MHSISRHRSLIRIQITNFAYTFAQHCVKYVCWRGFQARAATAESNTHTATDTKLEKVAAAEASGPAVVVAFPAPARAITSVVAAAAVVELPPVCNRE